MQTLSTEERSRILDEEVRRYVKGGYRVESRTATAAQLVKSKKFSWPWALLWLLVVGIGFLFYWLYYVAKKDHAVYLEVDGTGKIRKT